MGTDGNRNPNPSVDGEIRAIRRALKQADLAPSAVDYINSHGTGSPIGDVTELSALQACRLQHAWVNATKSIIGHGLSAAGAVELIAVVLQMQAGQLHPTRNLDNPIEPDHNWVRQSPVAHNIRNALNLSMGFGGVNSAICVQRH